MVCSGPMDPALRTFLVIFLAVTIKAMILSWWDAYKERKSKEPIPMKLRKGVYVPWGPVQIIQHFGWRFTQVWMAYIVVLVVLLIAFKTGLWGGF